MPIGTETPATLTASSSAPRPGKARPIAIPKAIAAKIHKGRNRSIVERRRTINAVAAGTVLSGCGRVGGTEELYTVKLRESARIHGSSFHSCLSLASFLIKRCDAAKTCAHTTDEILVYCMIGSSKTVVRKPEVAFYLDETHSAQISQVSGNGRLRQIENLNHIEDTQLACGKETQDSDPRWIGKALEHPVEVVDGRPTCRHRYLSFFHSSLPGCHIWHYEYNVPRRI